MTQEHSEISEKFIDPICGMTVEPETAAAKYEPETGETEFTQLRIERQV